MAPNFARILVPVDFSDCSKLAWEHAAAIAGKFGSNVEIIHVWEAPAYAGTEHVLVHTPATEPPMTLRQYVEAEARTALEKFVASLDRGGIRDLKATLEAGDPSDVILKRAPGFDLIVLGTHGHGMLVRLVFGSVAERVLRHAKVPVLAVAPQPNG